MKINILPDENFEESYRKIIVPFKNQYQKSEFYNSFDSKKLHYLSYENKNELGKVVIIHGFTECAEKFDETAYYFFSQGYSVYCPDLRGHGLSYKDPCPEHCVDSLGFDIYAEDLAVFFKEVISSPSKVYTHSLGGLALLLMSINHPNIPIEKAVLSSPMICGKMGMPIVLAKSVAPLFVKLNKGTTPVPKKCEFNPDKKNPDAFCEQRGLHSIKQKANNPSYTTCGPTFRWVLNSVKAKDKVLTKENVSKINYSMLIIKPEQDGELSEKYQDIFIELCKEKNKNLSVIKLANTRHEIFQSKEKELCDYFEKIFSFFEKNNNHTF